MNKLVIKLARRAVLLTAVLLAPLTLLGAISDYAAPAVEHGGFERGLLWRVEKPGVAASHVFGTIHVADQRVTSLPSVVTRQLVAARSFTMEIALDGPGLFALASRMEFDDGRDLPAVAGEQLFSRVVPLLEARGMPQGLARTLKPWAAMLMLATPPQQPEQVLDFVLSRLAARQRVPVYFLETVDDQIAALEGMPDTDQVALLRLAVESQSELPALTRRLIEAYLQRDLALMWRINEAGIKDRPDLRPLSELFAQRLLYDRNRRMVEHMQPQLRQGNAFIAVGALHLYGDKGILSLLEREGWRVIRVY